MYVRKDQMYVEGISVSWRKYTCFFVVVKKGANHMNVVLAGKLI